MFYLQFYILFLPKYSPHLQPPPRDKMASAEPSRLAANPQFFWMNVDGDH